MKIFISASSNSRVFIDAIREVALARGDPPPFFCPDLYRYPEETDLLRKVLGRLDDSHLVLMDVSMTMCDDQYVVNQGVLIEFGLCIYWRGLQYVYLFCDENTDRMQLPPLMPRVDVQQYNSNDPESIRDLVRNVLATFERELPERERRFQRQSFAALNLLGSSATIFPHS